MMLYFFDTKIQLFPLFLLRSRRELDDLLLSLSPDSHLPLGDNPEDNPHSTSKGGTIFHGEASAIWG